MQKWNKKKKCHQFCRTEYIYLCDIPIMSDKLFKMKRLGEVKDILEDLRARAAERGEAEELERKEKFVRHVLGVVPKAPPKPQTQKRVPTQISMVIDLTEEEDSADSSKAVSLKSLDDLSSTLNNEKTPVDLRCLLILENNVLGHDALKEIMRDQLRPPSKKEKEGCLLDEKQMSNAVQSLLLLRTDCDSGGDHDLVAAYFVIHFLGPACLQRQDFPTELCELIQTHESLVTDKILRPLMLLEGDPCPPDKLYSLLDKIRSPDVVPVLARNFCLERTILEEGNQFMILEMFIEQECLFGDPGAVSELCKCLKRSGRPLSKSSKFAKCLASVLKKLDISKSASNSESLDNLRRAAVDNATFLAKSVIKELDKKRKP